MKKTTNKTTKKITVGLVASGAAAAAGYYFYGSPEAKSHRKIAAKWAAHLKDEVIKEVKNLKRPDSKSIATIVDHVAGKYNPAHPASTKDLKRAAKELKANWKTLELETKRTIRQNISRTKTAKKVVK